MDKLLINKASAYMQKVCIVDQNRWIEVVSDVAEKKKMKWFSANFIIVIRTPPPKKKKEYTTQVETRSGLNCTLGTASSKIPNTHEINVQTCNIPFKLSQKLINGSISHETVYYTRKLSCKWLKQLWNELNTIEIFFIWDNLF